MALASLLPPRAEPPSAWAICVLALATIAGAWIFQAFGIQPCELCLTQRYVFYVGVPLAALTALAGGRAPVAIMRAGFLLIAVIFAANALLAAYHTGVEFGLWKGPTACTGSIDAADITDLLNKLELGEGRALRRGADPRGGTVARRLGLSDLRRHRALRRARFARAPLTAPDTSREL